MKKLLILSLAVLFFACNSEEPPRVYPNNPVQTGKAMKGVWVTNVASTALGSLNAIKETVQTCKKSNITDIYVVVWNKGRTLYPSEIMNKEFGISIMEGYEGRDPLLEMITEAHKEKIKVHAWFEYGFAASNGQQGGVILKKYPQWAAKDVNKNLLVSSNGFEWMNGINPDVQNFMKSLILEVVKKYDVDGIQGDDRLPAMPIAGGYDDYTVQLYKTEKGVNPPTNEKDAAWQDWRASKLTEFLGDLYKAVKAAKPTVIVSMAPSVHPWAKDNYLQDWPTWLDKKYCDYVIPQIYRYDFAAYSQTLKSQVSYVKNSADRSKLFAGVLIQSGTYNATNQFVEQMVNENRNNYVNGEIFFFFEGLKYNSEYFTTKYATK
ncbi:glycoside hydrolase family 10 protein [Flavobacterium sp. KACC 22761]|uniref:glycoside hydrolase family 10 protein n=1 Tax=Flavobacterium sp. KACC 22761 TaxID=3092665 RepID=UPI002A756FE5|nr:family 10 glycosylhydrolase [Flavobacterium sp. KACC 22761]WPO78295.1 family 10 glycosylhydrolase [Flavobacterium sp. KACC 22761]